MRYFLFVLALTLSYQSIACHTPSRSAELLKRYPDPEFSQMLHAAHKQPYKGYKFQSPSLCVKGMSDIYPCNNVHMLGHLDLPSIGGGQGADSWGWTDSKSGRKFALVGRSNGVSFVEITDPKNPEYLGNLASEFGISTWRDIKTYKNHAFIVADEIGNHGMQVFDLNQLLSVKTPPVQFGANVVYRGGQFQEAHNIIINEDSGFAYLVGGNTCNGGLHFVDINNPLTPQFRGCFSSDGYTHDAQCVIYNGPDTDYNGKELCFASNEDTVTVVDVTEKASPVMVERFSYTGAQYTHQGWLSEDQRYFIIDDELDELLGDFNTRTHVIDFFNIDKPVAKGFFEADGKSIDHNQYILGDYTYQANYSRGLRVLRLDDLANAQMTEVAYFDTYPDSDTNQNFPGAWNVYPFFGNGLVIISDINRGVFILQVDLNEDLIYSSGFD